MECRPSVPNLKKFRWVNTGAIIRDVDRKRGVHASPWAVPKKSIFRKNCPPPHVINPRKYTQIRVGLLPYMWHGKQLRKNSLKIKKFLTCLSTCPQSVSFFHSFNSSNARSATVLAPFWLYYFTVRVMWSIGRYSNFSRLLSIVTLTLWESNSLNVGTEEIFPGRILKIWMPFWTGRKKFQFLHARSWPFTRVRARAYGTIFFSKKIDFLLQHMGTGPQVNRK